MICRLAPVLLLFALCAPVRADELADRLEAAVAKCGSEDPVERVEGARLLGEIADVDPNPVMKVVDHPDPEVAGIAATVLVNRGIFREPEKAARCRELLDELAKEELEPAVRRPLIEELLNLGAPAVAIVEAELAEAKTEDVATPVTVLDADAEQVVSLRLKNTGRRGLWFNEFALHSYVSMTDEFGRRPTLGGRMGGRHNLIRSFDGRPADPPPAPEEAVLQFLSFQRRIAPGATFKAGSCKLPGTRCGIVSVRSDRAYTTNRRRYEGTFSGRALVNETAPFSVHPTAKVVLLAERRGPWFRLAAVREGNGWALEVTALADCPARQDQKIDPFWWAAEDSGRLFLGCGPLRAEYVEDADWKKDEVRRLPLSTALPAGTTRLWFGYDHDLTKEKFEQYVAAPVEIKDGK